jgi:hypothetical protein
MTVLIQVPISISSNNLFPVFASALQNNLIVATRNVADFLPGGVQVINPWE